MKELTLVLILIPFFANAQLTGDLKTDVLFTVNDSIRYETGYLEFRLDKYRANQVRGFWFMLGSAAALFTSTLLDSENSGRIPLYAIGAGFGGLSAYSYINSFKWLNKSKGKLRQQYYFMPYGEVWKNTRFVEKQEKGLSE